MSSYKDVAGQSSPWEGQRLKKMASFLVGVGSCVPSDKTAQQFLLICFTDPHTAAGALCVCVIEPRWW